MDRSHVWRSLLSTFLSGVVSIYLTYNSGKEYKNHKDLSLDIFHLNLGQMNELDSLYNNNNNNKYYSRFFAKIKEGVVSLFSLSFVFCLYHVGLSVMAASHFVLVGNLPSHVLVCGILPGSSYFSTRSVNWVACAAECMSDGHFDFFPSLL